MYYSAYGRRTVSNFQHFNLLLRPSFETQPRFPRFLLQMLRSTVLKYAYCDIERRC